MENKFPCHGCGACCMMVGEVLESDDNVNPEYLDLVHKFPYKADKFGWCEKLDNDFKCSVYESRPALCRVDHVWKLLFSETQTLDEYFTRSTLACKNLMEIKLGMTQEEIESVYEKFTP